jgi:serine/threonine-protein kinase
VLSLETGEQKILIEDGRQATYVNTGHLIYEQTATGNLMAVSFDLATLEVTSGPVTVLQGVRERDPGVADYALSEGGTLVYVTVGSEGQRGELVWVDRKGTEELVTKEKRNYLMPRISPDETRVSVAIDEDDGSRNVWIYDFEHDLLNRFTFEGRNSVPVWTPDGKWITFDSSRDGPRHLFRRLADGSGPAEPLITTNVNPAIPSSWSPDGSELAFYMVGPVGNRDIWILSMEGDQEPRILITSPNTNCCAVFSPDGKWLAYVSSEKGQLQVYVSPYPEVDVKYLVSGDQGGGEPVWASDGKELFYRSSNKMMVVTVETEPTFRVGKPEELFEGSFTVSAQNPGYLQYYDISPDGQRFLMIKQEQTAGAQINVVLNWFEELKRLVPTE